MALVMGGENINIEAVPQVGTGEKSTIVVNPEDKVAEVKDRLAGIYALEKERFALSFRGKPMNDENRMLKEYGVGEGGKLDMVPTNLEGGEF